jgi:hypothetical protein
MARFARAKGLAVDVRERMTIEDLHRAVDKGYPVVAAFQAWRGRPESSRADWEDGHYAVVIGTDEKKAYLMDPSTAGDYAFILISEFLARWHDYEPEPAGLRVNLVRFGMILRSTPFDSFVLAYL